MNESTGWVRYHFLDSGVFSLRIDAEKYAKEKGVPVKTYYDSPEYWKYVDNYAEFVKKYKRGIDYYANVDVIGDPVLSWRNQKYLEEKHGLSPVPVYHISEEYSWYYKYAERYDYICIGGWAATNGNKEQKTKWIDRCFRIVCDSKSIPTKKLHGFGITSWKLLIDFPWFSVDSTSWIQLGAYGVILIPHKRHGKFTFSLDPIRLSVSLDRPRENGLLHYMSLSKSEQRIVREWLDIIGMEYGELAADKKTPIKLGVICNSGQRKKANVLTFQKMADSLPEWPWPMKPTKDKPRLGVL
jgi:hypothetical protein